jgi:2-isopropylmalate synthase
VQTRRITILDTTLRDGEQSPGIALAPDEKVEIAHALDALGVDVIEAGFAVSSPGDFEGVRAVAAAVSRPTVASLSRTRREDLDAAVEALAVARGRTRVHIVLATSPIHMEFKLGLEPEEVVEQARESVAYVAGRVDEVEFACEDATRSDPAFVSRVCRAAVEAGRDNHQPARHGRIHAPRRVRGVRRRRARALPRARPRRGGGPLPRRPRPRRREHARGVRAGASQVECTVNGIGERAGVAALEEVAMALRVRADAYGYDTGIDVGLIGHASRLVSELTGYAVQPNKAIVGANAFAHEAGIHQDGMLKHAGTYQIMDPEELGLTMTLPARQALRPARISTRVHRGGAPAHRRTSSPSPSPASRPSPTPART